MTASDEVAHYIDAVIRLSRERDAFRDALEHERSLNETVIAPHIDALREIAEMENSGYQSVSSVHFGRAQRIARDVLSRDRSTDRDLQDSPVALSTEDNG